MTKNIHFPSWCVRQGRLYVICSNVRPLNLPCIMCLCPDFVSALSHMSAPQSL